MENSNKEKGKARAQADLAYRVWLDDWENKIKGTIEEQSIPIDKTEKFEDEEAPPIPETAPSSATSKRRKSLNMSSRKIANQAARKVSLQLTEETVRRKSVSDAMQHPSTMLPAAVCLISGGYLLLLAPIFGGGISAMAIGAISGMAAVVSFRISYPKIYQKNYRELKLSFDIAREQLEEEELKVLRDTVKAGFSNIGSLEGLTVLDHLSDEYDRFKTYLNQQRITAPLSVSIVLVLAEDTYRRGLGVLTDTLELMNVVRTPCKGKVEEDIALVEHDIEKLKNDPTQAERLKLKEEVAASLKERLATINRLNLWIEQLLYQAQRCQAVLNASRIEIATARAGSTKSSVDSVIKVLEERIRQVKEFQEEINRLGY